MTPAITTQLSSEAEQHSAADFSTAPADLWLQLMQVWKVWSGRLIAQVWGRGSRSPFPPHIAPSHTSAHRSPLQATCHAAKVVSDRLKRRPVPQQGGTTAAVPQYDDRGVEIVPSFPAWVGSRRDAAGGGSRGGGDDGATTATEGLWEAAEAEVGHLQVLLRQVSGGAASAIRCA